ncbi:MAG: caspase family protein [Gammaproteobacteria bacterium]|nr:caspase family protein [Gammaproteobacteria bacterium]
MPHRLIFSIVAAAISIGSLGFPRPTLAVPDQKVALVIGNAEYSAAERLINPLNDAADMCASLKRLGYETLCYLNLKNRKEFVERLQGFVNLLKPKSKAVFYYAGHAVQIKGENYLVPTKARVRSWNEVTAELVSVDSVLTYMKKAQVGFSMVILDACRNNPFTAAGQHNSRSMTRSALPVSVSPPAAKAGDVAYGLGAIRDAPVGSIVLYATGSDDVAYDGEGRNGPLTKHILMHIETPGITVEEMIKRVTAGVQNETLKTVGHRQTPFVYSSFTGEFCFTVCGPKVDVVEMNQLRQERAELQKQLANPKSKQRVFVPPTL